MNWCMHLETTDVDEDGKAVCVKCGATLQQRLTRELLTETFEIVRRQGYHSMKCVETELGWCCADDCPTVKRALHD